MRIKLGRCVQDPQIVTFSKAGTLLLCRFKDSDTISEGWLQDE